MNVNVNDLVNEHATQENLNYYGLWISDLVNRIANQKNRLASKTDSRDQKAIIRDIEHLNKMLIQYRAIIIKLIYLVNKRR